MKAFSKFFKLAFLSALVLFTFSCSDDDEGGDQNPENIVEIALETPDLSSLVAALQAADGDLVTVLQGDGPFTVLAPTNAAFADFLAQNGFNSLDEVPTDLLAKVLLNHVISADITSGDLVSLGAGYTKTNASGPGNNFIDIYFNTTSGVRFNDIASVTSGGADIDASNGVIHIVDAVITLPTVVTFAAADPNFSTLVAALTTLTPNTDFVSILSRTEGGNNDGINPEFTVFAPTNDAFTALGTPPAEDLLTQVLLHHVVAEANVTSSDLNPSGDTPAPTLEGDNITITLPGTGDNIADVTDGSGNTDIGIIAVDVQADNGVIHILNKVMIPDTSN